MDDEIQSVLYICREVSVYRIPPLQTNAGYRAGEWGDLAAPLWKGRLRFVQSSSSGAASLLLEDSQTGELFAKTEYDPARPCVEAVLDSSRYFVVRVEDAGRKAYIGLGFAERTDSFDFNVALQDHTKRWRAQQNPPTDAENDQPSPHVPQGPKKDYSLKEGQTFSITIPGRENASSVTSPSTGSSSSTGASIPLLPPPPSAPKRR